MKECSTRWVSCWARYHRTQLHALTHKHVTTMLYDRHYHFFLLLRETELKWNEVCLWKVNVNFYMLSLTSCITITWARDTGTKCWEASDRSGVSPGSPRFGAGRRAAPCRLSAAAAVWTPPSDAGTWFPLRIALLWVSERPLLSPPAPSALSAGRCRRQTASPAAADSPAPSDEGRPARLSSSHTPQRASLLTECSQVPSSAAVQSSSEIPI